MGFAKAFAAAAAFATLASAARNNVAMYWVRYDMIWKEVTDSGWLLMLN